jgi:hypothetical protein
MEKSRQVELMGLIYQRAFSTIIWLGDTSAKPGIELLQRVHEEWKFASDELSVDRLEAYKLPYSTAESWQHLINLFNRPWFRRLWIIQEVVLSSRSYVLSGAYIAPWTQFSTPCGTALDSGFMAWLERKATQGTGTNISPSIIAICRIASELADTSDCFFQTNSGSPGLLPTLVDTRYAEATDPRDKVYGTLGICHSNIVVDYTFSAAAVFRNATAAILEEKYQLYDIQNGYDNAKCQSFSHGFFRILSCVDHEPQPAGVTPSWVPDWSRPRKTDSLGYRTSAPGLYDAGRVPRDFAHDLHLHSFVDAHKMTVPAYIFDEITETVTAGEDVDLSRGLDPQLNRHLVEFAQLASKCDPYPSSDGLFTAFWHTLVAGRDGAGREKCPTDYGDIFSLLLDTATGQQPSLPGQTYSQRRLKGFMTMDSLGSRTLGRTFADLRKAHLSAVGGRSLASTTMGYLGLVPEYVTRGDLVCVIAGYPVPFVLRSLGNGTHHLLGECYVHGIMSGELSEKAVYGDVILV